MHSFAILIRIMRTITTCTFWACVSFKIFAGSWNDTAFFRPAVWTCIHFIQVVPQNKYLHVLLNPVLKQNAEGCYLLDAEQRRHWVHLCHFCFLPLYQMTGLIVGFQELIQSFSRRHLSYPQHSIWQIWKMCASLYPSAIKVPNGSAYTQHEGVLCHLSCRMKHDWFCIKMKAQLVVYTAHMGCKSAHI